MIQKIFTRLCFVSFLVFDSVQAKNARRPLSGADKKTLRGNHQVRKAPVDIFQRSSHYSYINPSETKEYHGNGGTKAKGRKEIKHFGKSSINTRGKGTGRDKAGTRASGKRWSGNTSSSKGKKGGNYAPSAPSFPFISPTYTIPSAQPTTIPKASPTPAPSSQPSAESILLYSNDFESPKQAVVAGGPSCPMIDSAGINQIYGTEENTFAQTYTVEVFLVDSAWNSSVPYSDPQGRAGLYAISMLSAAQGDLLGLSFETSGKAFVNVAMDVSSIDLPCAGGPFTIDAPIFRVSLLNAPLGTVPLTGPALDFADMTGPVGSNQWTFRWTRNSVSLNATRSSGRVAVVFDLIQSGYGALDNLIIEASNQPRKPK